MRPTIYLVANAILMSGALVASASSQVIFETSFEASDVSGASYTLGDLDGQGAVDAFGGWQVTAGTAEVVAGPQPLGASDGSNSVHQSADSSITAEASSASERVIIRAWHNGTGTSQVLEEPVGGTLAAAILGFESTGDDTYVVKAYDGPGGTGGYVAPASPLQLSTSEWNKIVVSVNYATQTFDVAINNEPYLSRLNFFNPAVTSFNGFQASSQEGAYIDLVGFFASDGDYDNDGIGDDAEMTVANGDPLDPTVTPGTFGDMEPNGARNMVDAILYRRTVDGTIAGSVTDDINADGAIDASDAAALLDYVVGNRDFIGK